MTRIETGRLPPDLDLGSNEYLNRFTLAVADHQRRMANLAGAGTSLGWLDRSPRTRCRTSPGQGPLHGPLVARAPTAVGTALARSRSPLLFRTNSYN